jgi:phosphinothricin acetyltransferase
MGRDETRIRPARAGDLPELVRIYNHYVATTHITFDTEPFSEEGRRPWLDSFSLRGPHRLFVATLGERPVGYASSSGFRPKPAYGRSVETTIYLDPDFAGRGIGRALYEHLLEALGGEPSVHRAYAGIALPNAASVALHERLGFALVGTFREVGFKLGKYWHVSWYEKEFPDPRGGEAG